MHKQKPITITATELHRKRGEILRKCFRDKQHFIVEKDGLPLVVIVPINQYQTSSLVAEPPMPTQ